MNFCNCGQLTGHVSSWNVSEVLQLLPPERHPVKTFKSTIHKEKHTTMATFLNKFFKVSSSILEAYLEDSKKLVWRKANHESKKE